jgi:cyanophycinase
MAVANSFDRNSFAASSPGPVALVGSGEYLDVMRPVDRTLLDGRPQRAVFLPTASAEEGPETVQYWLDLGRAHFAELGAEPVELPVLTREDADNPEFAAAIAGAGLVYLSGGNPGYLASTLRDTLVWSAILDAWRAGTAVAGCSAGACALSWAAADVRAARAARIAGRGSYEESATGEEPEATGATGLAMIASLAVIPHFDRIVSWVPGITIQYLSQVPAGVAIVGVDEDTAIVSQSGLGAPWLVAGRQAAWVIDRDGSQTRYEAGEVITAEALGSSS